MCSMLSGQNYIICCWIFRYIKKQVYKDGHTGKVAFDNNGDRIYAEYDIVNVKQVAKKDAIGKYYFDNVINDDSLSKKLEIEK